MVQSLVLWLLVVLEYVVFQEFLGDGWTIRADDTFLGLSVAGGE